MSYDYGGNYYDDPLRRNVDAEKDPDEVQDFKFSWVLVGGDVIITSEFLVTDVTEDSSSFDEDTAIIWLSGGAAGTIAEVTNRITTSSGRSYDRTKRIRIREM